MFRKPIPIAFLLFIISFLMLTISRMFIVWINPALFPNISLFEQLKLALLGMRFDWVAFTYLSIPALLVFILFTFFSKSNFLNKLFYFMLIIPMILGAAINVVDATYYPFILCRSTGSIFNFLKSNNGFSFVWSDFLMDFWYAWTGLLVLIIFYIIISKKLLRNSNQSSYLSLWKSIVLVFFILFFWAIGSRGGLQYKPLSIQSASKYTQTGFIAATLNTPFTLMKTLGKNDQEAFHFFDSPEKLIRNYDSKVQIRKIREFNNKNLVIIILESFSKDHIAHYNPEIKTENLTPFIDSLFNQSLTFEAIANGKQSIQALPAIVSSLPSIMSTPISASSYSMNRITSIAMILEEFNYESSFLHGGFNGTMNFDAFLAHAGFNTYLGFDELHGKDHYDGKWGIWDEAFFDQAIKYLNQRQKPFFSVLFSLSSHHPYKVPAEYQNILPSGRNKIHQTIAYTDLALKQFFWKASKSDWFKNTLFVITADHTSEAYKNDDLNELAQYTIPLAFYDPSDSSLKGKSPLLAQQTDIFPSVISYLGIDTSIIGYGTNIFDSNHERFALNYVNFVYNHYQNDTVLIFNGKKSIGAYNFRTDPKYKRKLPLDSVQLYQHEIKLKAILQDYSERLKSNHLTLSK